MQDIVNIVTFIAPGYFAITLYSLRYAKSEKDFSRLVVESIVWSLPLIAVADFVWNQFIGKTPTNSLNSGYVFFLLLLSVLAGFLAGEARKTRPVAYIAQKLGLGTPDEDFYREQFTQLKSNASVTVSLKSGDVFSGAPSTGSIYRLGGPRKYRFDYIAWYDEDKNRWVENNDSIIVDLAEVNYMVLPAKATTPSKRRRAKTT